MRIVTADDARQTVFSFKRSASIGLPRDVTAFRLNATRLHLVMRCGEAC
jgi:hypothetical protein